MIAEVGRIIGPNSHAINANRENSSVSSIVNALLKMWRAIALAQFEETITEMLLDPHLKRGNLDANLYVQSQK